MSTQVADRRVGAMAPRGMFVALGSGVLSGILVGVLVGGFGARLAMRVAGALSEPRLVGVARTANGNTVGEITVAGTLALIFFSILFPALIAGGAFAAARPWLAPLGRWAGLAYGLVLLAAFGPVVFEIGNLDFIRFGPPSLNVALFALLFPLFGLSLGIAAPRVDSWTSNAPPGSAPAVLAVGATILLGLTVLLLTIASVGTVLDAGVGALAASSGLLYLLLAPPVLRVALSRGEWLDDLQAVPRPVAALSYVVLLLPAALGAPETIEGFRFLAR